MVGRVSWEAEVGMRVGDWSVENNFKSHIRKLLTNSFPRSDPLQVMDLSPHLAGTWEEKNLNTWATSRIKELLNTLDSLEFSGGKAGISEVSKCTGDAFLVTVRNKKRVGYNYEITLKFKGEWLIGEENKSIKGFIDIHEFSFGELDDLQIEVRLDGDKDLVQEDKIRISKDARLFLPHIQKKLSRFEEELKDR